MGRLEEPGERIGPADQVEEFWSRGRLYPKGPTSRSSCSPGSSPGNGRTCRTPPEKSTCSSPTPRRARSRSRNQRTTRERQWQARVFWSWQVPPVSQRYLPNATGIVALRSESPSRPDLTPLPDPRPGVIGPVIGSDREDVQRAVVVLSEMTSSGGWPWE